MSETKVGMNPMHRGMTTIQVRKSQESRPQPGERFSTVLEIFLRRGVIRSSYSAQTIQ
jgi:hypothetical protein